MRAQGESPGAPPQPAGLDVVALSAERVVVMHAERAGGMHRRYSGHLLPFLVVMSLGSRATPVGVAPRLQMTIRTRPDAIGHPTNRVTVQRFVVSEAAFATPT